MWMLIRCVAAPENSLVRQAQSVIRKMENFVVHQTMSRVQGGVSSNFFYNYHYQWVVWYMDDHTNITA